MTIALTHEQRRWFETAVAAGRFSTVEEGVQTALTALMTEAGDQDGEADDDWVGPQLDEARAALARGEGVSLEEFEAHVERRLRELD